MVFFVNGAEWTVSGYTITKTRGSYWATRPSFRPAESYYADHADSPLLTDALQLIAAAELQGSPAVLGYRFC